MISKKTNENDLQNFGFDLNVKELFDVRLPNVPKVDSVKDKMSESIDKMKSLNSEAKHCDESMKMY